MNIVFREQGIPSLIADDSIEASQSRPFPAVNKGEVRGVITIPSISSYGEPKEDTPFLKWMNAKTQAAIVREQNDKNVLRRKWKEKLGGVDVFLPYFKAKEVEDYVKDKFSVRLRGLRGRPEFKDNQIRYIFRVRF